MEETNKQDKIDRIYEVPGLVNDHIWQLSNERDCIMVGDILYEIEGDYHQGIVGGNEGRTETITQIIMRLWKDKRHPIQSQSEDCIDYIYNLIQD